MNSPTLATLQTAPGKGGIAVIELRGPAAGEILARVFQPLPSHAIAGGDRLQLGRLVVAGRVIDQAIVAWCDGKAGTVPVFPCAEINIHGGPQIARSVLEALVACGATVEGKEGTGKAGTVAISEAEMATFNFEEQ